MMHTGDVDLAMILLAWRSQFPAVASVDSNVRWEHGRGLAGAFARSLLVLGWKYPSAFNMRTRGDEAVDLMEVFPVLVKWIALKGYEVHGWLQWSMRPDVMLEIPGPSHKDPAGADSRSATPWS
eukprot:6003325-Pyramimonas_sp.AAC.1